MSYSSQAVPGARRVLYKNTSGWLVEQTKDGAAFLRDNVAESTLLSPEQVSTCVPEPLGGLKNLRLTVSTLDQRTLQAALKRTDHGPKKFQGGWGRKRVVDAIFALSTCDLRKVEKFLHEKGPAMEAHFIAQKEEEERRMAMWRREDAKKKLVRALAQRLSETRKRKFAEAQDVQYAGSRSLEERLKKGAKTAHVVD